MLLYVALCKAIGQGVSMKKLLFCIVIINICSSLAGCKNTIREDDLEPVLIRLWPEKKVVVRYRASQRTKGFENVVFPEYEPVLGDNFHFKHTGKLTDPSTLDDDPSLVGKISYEDFFISKGEVKEYTFKTTHIIHIENTSVDELKTIYKIDTPIVILNTDGYFDLIKEYEGTSYYISFDRKEIPDDYNCDDYTPFTIKGIYAYNPRP